MSAQQQQKEQQQKQQQQETQKSLKESVTAWISANKLKAVGDPL